MPFLEVDGKRIGGSAVIARFLSERFGRCCSTHLLVAARAGMQAPSLPLPGLAGSDDVENAQIAAVVDAVDGITTEVIKVVFEKDEEKKVWAVSQFPAVCVYGACSVTCPLV